VPSERIGLYLLPLAVGNFCGPLFLGSLFDTIGRKAMIAGTFAVSGLLLLMTAYLFAAGFLTPVTQTIAWFSIFFFASAAASSAYLTASEIFPLETRALAIACFYALGTAIGGSTSPLLFGWLIESGSAWRVSAGYALAAALLLIRRDGIGAGNRRGRKVARKHRGPSFELGRVEPASDPITSWVIRLEGRPCRSYSPAISCQV
jgi:MFS family permease